MPDVLDTLIGSNIQPKLRGFIINLFHSGWGLFSLNRCLSYLLKVLSLSFPFALSFPASLTMLQQIWWPRGRIEKCHQQFEVPGGTGWEGRQSPSVCCSETSKCPAIHFQVRLLMFTLTGLICICGCNLVFVQQMIVYHMSFIQILSQTLKFDALHIGWD